MWTYSFHGVQAKLVLTIQWDNLDDFKDGRYQLGRLHYLHNRLAIVSPRLRATLEIVEALKLFVQEGACVSRGGKTGSEREQQYREQALHEVRCYRRQIRGLLESSRSLERRIKGILSMVRLVTIGFYVITHHSSLLRLCSGPQNSLLTSGSSQLSAALNLRQQATGIEISEGVLKLTTETVNDSATVRVITFVTLLYLPASFIAVSRLLSPVLPKWTLPLNPDKKR